MRLKWSIIKLAISRWVITAITVFCLWKFGDRNLLTFALIFSSIFCELYWYLWMAK